MDRIVPDWTIFLVAPHFPWMRGTKFTPRNTAANRGRNIASGYEALEAIFAQCVAGACNRVFERTEYRLVCPTTVERAELLIPKSVVREEMPGNVVEDERRERQFIERLRMANKPVPHVLFGEDHFNFAPLGATLRSGNLPTGKGYHHGKSV